MPHHTFTLAACVLCGVSVTAFAQCYEERELFQIQGTLNSEVLTFDPDEAGPLRPWAVLWGANLSVPGIPSRTTPVVAWDGERVFFVGDGPTEVRWLHIVDTDLDPSTPSELLLGLTTLDAQYNPTYQNYVVRNGQWVLADPPLTNLGSWVETFRKADGTTVAAGMAWRRNPQDLVVFDEWLRQWDGVGITETQVYAGLRYGSRQGPSISKVIPFPSSNGQGVVYRHSAWYEGLTCSETHVWDGTTYRWVGGCGNENNPSIVRDWESDDPANAGPAGVGMFCAGTAVEFYRSRVFTVPVISRLHPFFSLNNPPDVYSTDYGVGITKFTWVIRGVPVPGYVVTGKINVTIANDPLRGSAFFDGGAWRRILPDSTLNLGITNIDMDGDGPQPESLVYVRAENNVQRVMLWEATRDTPDFNRDGTKNIADIAAFLDRFAGGPCPTPRCGSIDFNFDGITPDSADLDAFLLTYASGSCL